MRSGATPAPPAPGQTTAPSPQRDDGHALGHGEDARSAGSSPPACRRAASSEPYGPETTRSVLRVDDVVRVRLVALRLRLHLGEQRVERRSISTGSPRIVIDGPVSEFSRSKSSSCAVVPMISAAAWGSSTPGSWMTIWSSPWVRISGSETPSLSTRLRMISTERSRSSSVRSRFGGGTACSVTSSPPCRSRPSVGDLWRGDPGNREQRNADEGRCEQPENQE